MATFTSSLPDSLLQLLEEKAKELSLPKNKLIEQAPCPESFQRLRKLIF